MIIKRFKVPLKMRFRLTLIKMGLFTDLCKLSIGLVTIVEASG